MMRRQAKRVISILTATNVLAAMLLSLAEAFLSNREQESLPRRSSVSLESLLKRIRSVRSQGEVVSAADYDALIWQIRQIGLKRDRHHWKLLLDALHPEVLDAVSSASGTKRGRFHLQAAALMALARAGNPDAIEPIQQAGSHLDSYFRREVLPVVIARLHTEKQFAVPEDLSKWNEMVSIFISKAGLSLPEAVADLDAYSKRKQTWPPDNLIEAPRGVVALRMLAEMATEAYAKGVPTAFLLFDGWTEELREKDPILWIRIQLGKRTGAERIVWLIDQLLADGVQTIEDRFLQQAIVDCGEQAVPALVAKIEALERSEHTSSAHLLHMELLIETLASFDSPLASQTLERLRLHPESSISEMALVYLGRRQRDERPCFVSWL